MPKIEELRDRQAEAHESATAIRNQAEAEKRDLTDDELKEVKNLLGEFDRLDDQIQQLERIDNQANRLSQSLGRQTEPERTARQPSNTATEEPEEIEERQVFRPKNSVNQPPTRTRVEVKFDRGKAGWRNFGEFARGVALASNKANPVIDVRFTNATPSTYSSEGIGSDGGFAVPPDFRTAIMEKVFGEDSLISRTDLHTTTGNTLTIPKDETTPWQTSGGIQAYWGDEGALKTQSKIELTDTTVKLNKLYALVPVTDELLEDAPGLDAYLRRKAPEKINFKVNVALISGTGVGQPLGVLNSPATVSVAKESSQAADTINFSNVTKMYSRLYAPLRRNAVWLVNQDVEPQLMTMSMTIKNVAGTENVGGVPVWMPANGISGSPYSTLFGRPVIPSQALETLGDKGDIILGDWGQYLAIQKAGGIKTDVSIHLWFDYDITAFRFVLRIGGQPWWNSSISARDGSNTMGAFVTLDERA